MSGSGEAFLSRWSRRKLEARESEAGPAEAAPAPQAASDAGPNAAEAPPPRAPNAPAEPLPPVESLTSQSDFRPFMGADVPLETRQAALKKLFADSYFNVPDPFEAYMEDYTKADPIPIGMLRTLDHARQVLMPDETPPAEAVARGDGTAAEPDSVDGADPSHAQGEGHGPAGKDA